MAFFPRRYSRFISLCRTGRLTILSPLSNQNAEAEDLASKIRKDENRHTAQRHIAPVSIFHCLTYRTETHSSLSLSLCSFHHILKNRSCLFVVGLCTEPTAAIVCCMFILIISGAVRRKWFSLAQKTVSYVIYGWDVPVLKLMHQSIWIQQYLVLVEFQCS